MKIVLLLLLSCTHAVAKEIPWGCFNVLIETSSVEEKVDALISAIDENRSLSREMGFGVSFRDETSLLALQNKMYDTGLLQVDKRFDLLEDKLVMGKLLERLMAEKAHEYYARSLEITDEIISGDVKEYLKKQFPEQVVMKLRRSSSSGGIGIFFGHDQVANYIKENPEDAKRYFLQSAPPKAGALSEVSEYRTHTLWNKVIPKATLSRWSFVTSPLKKKPVEDFLQGFLDSLPEGMLKGHAWSLDIVKGEHGYRIVDINTAGSHRENWSGFLQNPFILSKLVHALERDFQWRFPGWAGFWMKHNISNGKKVKTKVKQMYEKHGVLMRPAK